MTAMPGFLSRVDRGRRRTRYFVVWRLARLFALCQQLRLKNSRMAVVIGPGNDARNPRGALGSADAKNISAGPVGESAPEAVRFHFVLPMLAAAILSVISGACSKTQDAPVAPGPQSASAAPAAEGGYGDFIWCRFQGDYGYNQALRTRRPRSWRRRCPTSRSAEEENVPETEDVQKTMESMIEARRSLSAPEPRSATSIRTFSRSPVANIERHISSLRRPRSKKASTAKRRQPLRDRIDEAQYVSGIVAGMTTKTNKLGFIAAKPIPQVLRNINSFTLGARSVKRTRR